MEKQNCCEEEKKETKRIWGIQLLSKMKKLGRKRQKKISESYCVDGITDNF